MSVLRVLPTLAGAAAALLLVAAIAIGRPEGARSDWPRDPYPRSPRLEAALDFAAARPGTVSFAVIDADGGVRGLDQDRQFSSASVSKVLLLAAELRRLREEKDGLDAETRSLLEAMITYSDNDAAGSVYARVGDAGMEEVAERAGMRSFESTPGYWGGAQVTAADLARFFYGLQRNLVGRHADYARRLLAGIAEPQRWGIPDGAPRGWRLYFKGGWRPPASEETSGPVTHQGALLRHRHGRRLGLAILSDQSPGETTYETLAGITRRLLAKDPQPTRWPAL